MSILFLQQIRFQDVTWHENLYNSRAGFIQIALSQLPQHSARILANCVAFALFYSFTWFALIVC